MAALSLSASLEDYLEAILSLVGENQVARVRDIAQRMAVTKASVTGALRSLSQKGLVHYQPYGVITLTRQGKKLARDVDRRHQTLKEFFHLVLGVEEGIADGAACQVEHSISPDLLDRFVQYVDYIRFCPRGGPKWIKDIGYRCVATEMPGSCDQCVSLASLSAGSQKGKPKGETK